MDQKGIKKALEKLEWSNAEAIERLGISRQTLNNYLTGNRPIPLSVQKFILLYLDWYKIIQFMQAH